MDDIRRLTFLLQQESHLRIHNRSKEVESEHPSLGGSVVPELRKKMKIDLNIISICVDQCLPMINVAQNTRRRISHSIQL